MQRAQSRGGNKIIIFIEDWQCSDRTNFLQGEGLQSGTMKIFYRFPAVLLCAGTMVGGLLLNPLHAATPEEQAVLASITAMFEGMAKHDAEAIKKPLLAGGTMVLMREGKPTQMTFEE